jgi:uncharacterized membrane-anchored protein
MTRIFLAMGAVLVFGIVNWQIAAKERLRSGGQVVYLDLSPVDPRSMMQGDYMALRFLIADAIEGNVSYSPVRVAVLRLDQRRIGRFQRLDSSSPLGPGEVRLRFRIRHGAVWLGTNGFFFQEGDQGLYRTARYGEFRLNEDGDAMLVALRDADLRRLGPR